MYEVDDIGALLEANGFGTVGANIFLYHAPPESNDIIIVFPSNDPPRLEEETPYYLKGKFQIIVRSSTFEDGRNTSKQISDLLKQYNIETAQMKVKRLRPLYQVRVYRRSDSGAVEFSVTYEIIYVQKTV